MCRPIWHMGVCAVVWRHLLLTSALIMLNKILTKIINVKEEL